MIIPNKIIFILYCLYGEKVISLYGMKTFNGDKTIRSKNIRIKICVSDKSSKLEGFINEWFETNDVEIVSIEYANNDNYIRAFILYKIA